MKNLFIVLSLLYAGGSTGQTSGKNKSNFPVIGKPCPDFVLHHIEHFSRKSATLKDFKGKWLILDLWIKNCSACIASFPGTNVLQQKFRDKVQFLLLGVPFKKDFASIRQVFEKSRDYYNLNLPVVYDPGFGERFGAPSYPHIIWIDDKGIVRAITGSLHVKGLEEFLAGNMPDVGTKSNEEELTNDSNRFDLKKPFLIHGNGGNDADFYTRSILTGWQKGAATNGGAREGTEPFGFFKPNDLLATNCPLTELYETAYGDTIAWYFPWNPDYGKWWTDGPLLEVTDSSLFSFDYDKGQNLFCYNLVVPRAKANKKKMQEIMQSELKNYFGYDVRVVKRTMPYWKLIASEKAKIDLSTIGGKPFIDASKVAIIIKNQPMSKIIELIWSLQPTEPPYVDDTGIRGNIDLTLNCVFTDFADLKRELQKNGLMLEKDEKEMNVIVISDPKN